jgi:hypothetical protein
VALITEFHIDSLEFGYPGATEQKICKTGASAPSSREEIG